MPWLCKTKAEYAYHICFETCMLSPGLLAQQAEKASTLWYFEMTPAVQLHQWESLRLPAGCFPGPQGTAGTMQKPGGSKAEQQQACTRTNSFFHREKELLKPSDKTHLFSPLEKKPTKQPKVAYAANPGSVQGIPWVCPSLWRDLKLQQYHTEKKPQPGSIENTMLFGFEILYSHHHFT